MELFFAAKHGDIAALTQILSTSQADVNFENSNFAEIDETRPKKSMYCAECYQRVKRRKRPELYGQVWGSTFSCDWANHVRSVVVTDDSADICCCTTPSGDKCNWLICVDCFVKVTYDLKASHQMYGLQEGYTPLIAAASGGHLECVKLLLDHGADINSADPQGLTALLAATSAIHVDVVKLLLERGADINSVDQLGVCALFMACEVGDVALVEVLLGFQPDLGIREVGGATVLHAAASSGHIGIMEALLDRGLDPKETTSEGDTPMHWLPCTASAASVRLLIDRGADVNAQNERHYTPILLSTLRDNAIATSTMLKAGAVTDIQTVGWGTPLTASCLGNFHRVTEVLLAAGVDHSIGSPPLGICARRDYPLAAAVCLKHGVKGAGDALVTAADAGNPAVVKVILEHWTGEDDMEQRYLDRALAHAAKSGVLSSVKMLLEQGADATVTFGANGETAADFAKNNKIRGLIKAHLSGDTMELEEDEETVGNNRHHLLHALKKGTKKWGRSKIMIVGDGRAGKTALANSIMGEEFAHTESTIGINQMTCDVKFAEVGKEGQWDEYTKPDKELEAALAKIVAARRGGEEEEDEEGSGPIVAAKKPSGNTAGHADDTGHEQGSASGPSKTGVGVKIGAGSFEEDASAAPATDAVMAIDDALVMKYLANLNDNTKFVISLFDYGGQTVFNVIHHLFLTRYGVYTLVFNMEQLVSSDPAVRESCLSTISFWLNSIVVHTWNTETESMAPIVIVGTHKDIVKSAAQHEQISRILEEKFRSSVAWPWIQENEDTEEEGGQNLCFFPVDNRKSRGDTTVVKMMKLIEDIIDKSDYVHLERPLTWLQTMDRLTACGKAYLPLVEVEAIAEECDVPRSAVPSLLAFLHEMGILMWHDDVSLRDVVILDAVAYFVTPVTTIICKHLATAMDTTRHVVEVHKKCRKQYYDAWMKMVHQGIVNTDILGTLLQDCGQHLPIVMHLMVKFGLVVPLQIAEQVKGQKATSGKPLRMEEFLVPALLPALSDVPEKEQAVANYSDEYTSSCLFVFSCSGRLVDSNIMTFENTANLGFLPRGLFERLICKAVEWCRETSAVQSLQAQPLFQDAAVLVFGNQKFRMRAFHDKNCIEVNFAQGNPLAVHQRLCDQLQQILDECMKSLRFFTVLPYPAHHPQQQPGKDDVNPALSSQYLVQLDYLRAISKKHTGLHAPSGEKLLGKTEIVEQYGAWLVDDTLREEYDVFISYRWGTLDSKYTERLRDRFTIYNVNADNRAVAVFLDNKRLRDGRNFVDDFGRSLINSRIVVPVVSSDALDRMRKHDPYHTDNVLMEWLMAIECFHSASSKVMRVLPMLFGKRDSNSDAIGNLYQEGALDEMPDIHPRETVRCALRLLQANGVEPRMGVSTYTVRSILMELKTILGYCTWTAESSSLVVAESAERVIISLQEVLDEGPKQAQTLSLARVWKSGPAADCGELLLTSPPRGDGTMQPLQDISTSAATGPARRTIKEVVDEIKAQLGLGPEVKMAQVFEQALDFIGDAALAEECQAVGGLAKAEKILTALVG